MGWMQGTYNVVKDTAGLAKGGLDYTRGVIGIAALALSSIGAVALAKQLSPSAVADNADKYILNETLKTSLAKARQDNEMLRRAKKLEELSMANRRLPHDKFV